MRKTYLTSVILACFFVAAQAQYSKLYEYVQSNDIANPDGGELVLDNNVLYGMTLNGGTSSYGCIYKIKTDGTGYAKLLDFSGTNGQNPRSSLIKAGNTLFGMTCAGGTNGDGCIFKIKTDGTGYTKLLDFSNVASGRAPYGALTLSGTMLYGTTSQGGANNMGCVFKIDTTGAGYVKMHDFNGTNGNNPQSTLALSGTTLYGLTVTGGAGSSGVLFKINTDGTGFTDLMDFVYASSGGSLAGSLTISGTDIYGMSQTGGSSGYGTIFKIKTDGTGYVKLLDLTGAATGNYPRGSLLLSGSVLYAMAKDGGANNFGCIFKINTDGSGFTKMLDFTNFANGGYPQGSFVISGSVLYGTTSSGGAGGVGNVFKINTDGTGFSTILHCSGAINGKNPKGSLVISGTTMFGMTTYGGAGNLGCIYSINTDGTGYTRLLDFNGTANGSNPYGSLTLSGTTLLYGMTQNGGTNSNGTIFKINTDGTGYTKLLDFNSMTNGSSPKGALTLSGTVLYGLCSNMMMGSNIFKINTDGTGFVKYDISTDGTNPYGALVLSGSVLYGMASTGGANAVGSIYKINTDISTGYSKLYDFSVSDGATPYGSLIISGTVLYGTTSAGGANSKGCIFKINTDGTGYTRLLDFTGAANGSKPYCTLLLSGNILYGTTSQGGANNKGCIFQINTDGTNYIKLLDFDGANNGGDLQSDLILSGKTLYGTANAGGVSNIGVIFKYGIPPSVQALGITFSNILPGQITIGWTNGDGDKRAVFVKENAGSITNPVNNTTYTASANWSSKGTQSGTSGYYCVYNGTGTSVTLTNLLLTASYTVQVFEYNGAAGSEQYDVATATKNPYSFQQINFNYLSPMAYSDTTITLPATSTGGLTISYASSNTSVATVSANSVTLKGPGLTNITASQAGDANFDPAVNVLQPLYVVGLCVVRYDNSEFKNMVVWEKPVTTKITSFKIYKEFGTGTYIPVKTVPYNIYSAVIDSASDPDTHADRYKLSVVDSAGKESRKSYFHKSPHIIFIGNNIFLQDNYVDEGGLFTPGFYYIYRGTSKSTLALHDSISGSLTTYTDPKFTGTNMFYQVGIKRTPNCVPTGILKAESGPYSQSLSNIAEFKGAKLTETNALQAAVYPNPFTDVLNIVCDLAAAGDVIVEITDMVGKKVYENVYCNQPAGNILLQINSCGLQLNTGIYNLKIISGGVTSVIKCAYQK